MADGGVKRIVCLANSRKDGGRCIAGKELMADGRPGGWVRPVSDRADAAVNARERQYAAGSGDGSPDGAEPRVLDVLDVPLRRARPQGHQQENWLLDPERRWRLVDRLRPEVLDRLADPAGPLWINGFSTHHGQNDRLPVAYPQSSRGAQSPRNVQSPRSSLRLARVDALELDVIQPRAAQGDFRRRIKGRFWHAGAAYRLWVTAPEYEETYLNRPNNTYTLGPCYLTVSLGEPYQGYAYKLIAAIIEL